jgi:hypothetical protein
VHDELMQPLWNLKQIRLLGAAAASAFSEVFCLQMPQPKAQIWIHASFPTLQLLQRTFNKLPGQFFNQNYSCGLFKRAVV